MRNASSGGGATSPAPAAVEQERFKGLCPLDFYAEGLRHSLRIA